MESEQIVIWNAAKVFCEKFSIFINRMSAEGMEVYMRKKLLSVALITAISVGCFSGCNSSEKKDTSDKASSEATSSEKEEIKTSAVSFTRTSNPDTFPLNGKDIFMEKDSSSWVKIATIWDPTLTIYDAESFVQGSKAIAATFEVSDMDVDPMTCYWNYQVVDSKGTEIQCWDTNYQTDDLEITGNGKYQMVFDYSKVEGQDVAEIQSLQIAFPNMKADTTMKVKVLDAVCITDEKEIGSVYKTGAVE